MEVVAADSLSAADEAPAFAGDSVSLTTGGQGDSRIPSVAETAMVAPVTVTVATDRL